MLSLKKIENYFAAYENGKITKDELNTKIKDWLNPPVIKWLPHSLKTKIQTKRLKSITEQIKTETDFINELAKHLRTRS